LDELRWILLVLGILAIGVIWLWSARGSRQAPGNAELREPTVTHPPEAAPVETRASAVEKREWGVPPLEPLSIRTADFAEVPALDQPMLTHADPIDFSLDSSRATGQARFTRSPTAVRELEPVPLDDESIDDEPVYDARADATIEIDIGEQVGEELLTETEVLAEEQARTEEETWVEEETRVEEGTQVEDARRSPEQSDRHAAVPPPANRSEKQKIVTVRVCAVGETRWAGAALMSALEALGLAFGRYQVYHRKHNDGRSIFCVASLVEPGTFDLSTMPDEQFRGVSLFAVLPGPLEPMQTAEALIATARELARALTGTMQDAKGIPFSPQRTEALLQDVARFQALLA
jgi:cell division protein ZipA